MGEYVKVMGVEKKIGTCEDLYYARLEQVLRFNEAWYQKIEGNLEPREYANPNLGFRYRFPFPEEDDVKVGDFKEYNKSLSAIVDKQFLSGSWMNFNWADGEDNLNNTGAYITIEIVQQKFDNDKIVVVLRDPFSGFLFRLPDGNECLLLAIGILASYDEDENLSYWKTVCSRMLKGYRLDYRELDYNTVVNWADQQGLNTDTPENWKEAAQAMLKELLNESGA